MHQWTQVSLGVCSTLDRYTTSELQRRFETVKDVKPPYAHRLARLYLHVLGLLTSELGKYRPAGVSNA